MLELHGYNRLHWPNTVISVIKSLKYVACYKFSKYFLKTHSRNINVWVGTHKQLSEQGYSIPYSRFFRLRRLCSNDSDFYLKSDKMCNFFDKRGHPASVVQAGHRPRPTK